MEKEGYQFRITAQPSEDTTTTTGCNGSPLVASYAAAVAARPAPVARSTSPQSQGVALPQTATDAELRMMLGLLFCTMSLLLIVVWRRFRLSPA